MLLGQNSDHDFNDVWKVTLKGMHTAHLQCSGTSFWRLHLESNVANRSHTEFFLLLAMVVAKILKHCGVFLPLIQ